MRNQKLEARSWKLGKRDGVALVVTLLMLSVITFMAVAFLAVSRRERASVAGTLNQVDAQAMADAALARAQADMAAYLMSHNTPTNAHRGRPNDMLNYGLMMSHNFVNPYGFDNNATPFVRTNLTNVSYAYPNGAPLNTADQIQNIANLYYDPRVPVYVQTNTSDTNLDFRYWLDYNRNGRFESNGLLPVLDVQGNPLVENNTIVTNYFTGEPEYIGVLRQPDQPHGSANSFIGRYAYLVLPIGKTLDLNYIHNYAKHTGSGKLDPTMPSDGYLRNQGHGPWELNMAGLLAGVNSNLWATDYVYTVQANVSSPGTAFFDALSFLKYRYNGSADNIRRLQDIFPQNNFDKDDIDEYSDGPLSTTAFNTPEASLPDNAGSAWPGSTNYNNFYDPQEIFDKLANTPFVGRLNNALAQLDTTNRYTFGRLLDSIGTDSEAELYCWVHEDDGKLVKRAKVNINFDNSDQIRNFNKDPLHGKITTPPVLTNWDALNFFTNAAEVLLRSQDFEIVTNDYRATNLPPSTEFVHFGLTNILIYSSANTNIHYSAAIHRMLQLAANIYDASGNRSIVDDTNNGVYFPSIFRPQFDVKIEPAGTPRATNFFVNVDATNVYITNWVAVINTNFVLNPFRSLQREAQLIAPDDNVWGVPLVVGAKKGLPNFNMFAYETAFDMTRKLKFTKNAGRDKPPDGYQMIVMDMTNLYGIEAWYPYQGRTKPFPRATTLWMTNAGYMGVLNESNRGTNTGYTNVISQLIPATGVGSWPGTQTAISGSQPYSNSFKLFMTNVVSLVPAQWSESKNEFQLNPQDIDWQRVRANSYPYHDWQLHSTNYLFYMCVDQVTGRLLDVVNIGDFGSVVDIYDHLQKNTAPPNISVWNTNGATTVEGSAMSLGVQKQLEIVTNNLTAPGYRPEPGTGDKFREFLRGGATNIITMDSPYQPSATLLIQHYYAANDPLVHYTIDDLTPPKLTNVVEMTEPQVPNRLDPGKVYLGQIPPTYQPWTTDGKGNQALQANMTFKDPMVMQPSDWQFPTNKLPSIGWLGRVHRGSPWQTFYLKSEATDPQQIKTDHKMWNHDWTTDATSYPTNDWRVLDLFTVAPTETAAHGLLSINQTNEAPWSALLSGLYVLTDNFNGRVIDPTNVPPIVSALNAARAKEDNQVFHHLGDFLAVPQLTRALLQQTPPTGIGVLNVITNENPSMSTNSYQWDVVMERIPQQVLSLVKLGDPRFVIYSFGQALKPANNSLVLGGQYRGMCTNYQITGEVVTRAVCRLSNDSTPTNPKFVVESFTILPGN